MLFVCQPNPILNSIQYTIYTIDNYTYSEAKVITLSNPAQTITNLNLAIFKHAATEGIGAKAASLFPGIGFGAAYKILQRVYKFGGQPVVLDIMTRRFGSDFDDTFGKKLGRTLMSATSGSIIGVGESKFCYERSQDYFK